MNAVLKLAALLALALLTACGGGTEEDFADEQAPSAVHAPSVSREAAR